MTDEVPTPPATALDTAPTAPAPEVPAPVVETPAPPVDAPASVAASPAPSPEPVVSPETVQEMSKGITTSVASAVEELVMGTPGDHTAPTPSPIPAPASSSTESVSPPPQAPPAQHAVADTVPIAQRRGEALAKRRAMKVECLEAIMRYAASHQDFMNDHIEEHFRDSGRPLSDSTVKVYLRELVSMGRLKRVGKGKGIRYTP